MGKDGRQQKKKDGKKNSEKKKAGKKKKAALPRQAKKDGEEAADALAQAARDAYAAKKLHGKAKRTEQKKAATAATTAKTMSHKAEKKMAGIATPSAVETAAGIMKTAQNKALARMK